MIETFKRHKTPLRMGVELPSLEAIKRFVEMGNGVALVPGLTVRTELASGALVRVRVKELQTGAQVAAGVSAAGEPVACGGGVSEGGGGVCGGARRSVLFSWRSGEFRSRQIFLKGGTFSRKARL